VPVADLERTLNLGVGMLAVVGADGVDAAVAALSASGTPTWVVGRVGPDDGSFGGPVVRNAKGAAGGAVALTGAHAP